MQDYQKIFDQAYTSLNAAQKEAVDALEGPVMVIAGPGTGKTTTLTVRIAKILSQSQVSPQNILCITFTDSAANNMRQRLISMIGPDAYRIKIYTFHSFCNEVIQSHPEKFIDMVSSGEPITERKNKDFKHYSKICLPELSRPYASRFIYITDISRTIAA
jgi:DNA helicase-2/ATP-dependent DNA helicase PcrA